MQQVLDTGIKNAKNVLRYTYGAGSLESLSPPARVSLWRRSRESLLRRRHPARKLIHVLSVWRSIYARSPRTVHLKTMFMFHLSGRHHNYYIDTQYGGKAKTSRNLLYCFTFAGAPIIKLKQ